MIVVAGEALIDLIVGAGRGSRPSRAAGRTTSRGRSPGSASEVTFLGRHVDGPVRREAAREPRRATASRGDRRRRDGRADDPGRRRARRSGAATYRFYVAGDLGRRPRPTTDAAGAVPAAATALHVGTLGPGVRADRDDDRAAGRTRRRRRARDARSQLPAERDHRPRRLSSAHRAARRAGPTSSRSATTTCASSAPGRPARTPTIDGCCARRPGRGARTRRRRDRSESGRRGTRRPCRSRAVAVVDTVGAGDAFGGGFLAAWIEPGAAAPSSPIRTRVRRRRRGSRSGSRH